MAQLHFENFRFSLSWSRILPHGKGVINRRGVDFYNRVIDTLLEKGITPWVTLYHWDLPWSLQQKGGWTNRDIVSWFLEYAEFCVKSYGDRVQHWMVLNEPMVFTGAGYFLGVHAPGMKGLKHFLPAVHHACLCQSLGGQLIRELQPKAKIGTTFSCSQILAYKNTRRHQLAANRTDALLNRLFLEPALGLGYPTESLPVLRRLYDFHQPEDEQNLSFKFDFIGLQNYTREVVKYSFWVPQMQARLVKAANRDVPTCAMGWEIYPPSIYHMIKRFASYPQVKSIIITENGLALEEQYHKTLVEDPARISYLQQVLREVKRAREQGLPVHGYFYWTFMDNFEWAEGYYPKFGLVHNKLPEQKRVLKRSALWWQEFLQS